jgi:hypothetical protein
MSLMTNVANIITFRVMLTGAPGALVKETKKRKFCIENNTFYTFEKLITQVPIKLYHIWFLNHCPRGTI